MTHFLLFFSPVLPIGYVRWRWWYRRKEPFWESWYKMVPYQPDHVIAREIELGRPIRKELYVPIHNKIDSYCRLCGAYMPKRHKGLLSSITQNGSMSEVLQKDIERIFLTYLGQISSVIAIRTLGIYYFLTTLKSTITV